MSSVNCNLSGTDKDILILGLKQFLLKDKIVLAVVAVD